GVDGLGGARPVGSQLGGAGAGGGDLPDEGGQLRVLVRELFGGCGVAGDGGALPRHVQLVLGGDERLQEGGGLLLLLLVAGDRRGTHLSSPGRDWYGSGPVGWGWA